MIVKLSWSPCVGPRVRPQPRERDQPPRPRVEVDRLRPGGGPGLGPRVPPLEEAVRRDQAAPARERVAEHRLVPQGLDPGVDHQRRPRPAAAGPVRDQPPPHHLDQARAVAQDHDRRGLGRGDVEARLPPRGLRGLSERGLEILDEAVLTGQRVAAAHGSASLAPADDRAGEGVALRGARLRAVGHRAGVLEAARRGRRGRADRAPRGVGARDVRAAGDRRRPAAGPAPGGPRSPAARG